MNKAKILKKGDKIGIVSLSRGILGEDFCAHQRKIGLKRLEDLGLKVVFMKNSLRGMDYLKDHPEKRAEDLKAAFFDDEIKGIICAIGGDDTYKLLPYLMEDDEFIKKVKENPKFFMGYSDSTINHLMFRKLGMNTFYGLSFLVDFGELADQMLPYTKEAFENILEEEKHQEIKSSEHWYFEREDFSEKQLGLPRTCFKEEIGFETLKGEGKIEGRLLGGCIESLYDVLVGERYSDEKEICERYKIFPSQKDWEGKILFIETSEERPSPEKYEKYLRTLEEVGIFDKINAVIVGKPQNGVYYEEYKEILLKVFNKRGLPILYNVNFGHAHPKTILPYDILTEIDFDEKTIIFKEKMFD